MSFRSKNALVTIVFILLCSLFLAVGRFSGFILYGTVIFMMILYYFLIYWMLNFEVYPLGLLSILVPPVLLLGSFFMIYYGFVKDLALWINILVIIFFCVLQYYFLLTQNILNTSFYLNIGLTQAAVIVNNFYSIITFFAANLAVFLVPDLTIVTKLFVSFILFTLLYLSFILTNAIDILHFWFGEFFYFIVIFVVITLFLLNALNPISALLIIIVLSVIYRGLTVISLYSNRKVISFGDMFQIALESILAAFFIYLATQ